MSVGVNLLMALVEQTEGNGDAVYGRLLEQLRVTGNEAVGSTPEEFSKLSVPVPATNLPPLRSPVVSLSRMAGMFPSPK